jgi:hypothetical protein
VSKWLVGAYDYDSGGGDGAELVARILDESSRRLSRTRSGVSDTRTSSSKQPLLQAGDALRQRAAENERRVYRFLFDTRKHLPPASGEAVLQILLTVADMTNDGLLPDGRWRTWPIGAWAPAADGSATAISGPEAKVPPELLPEATRSFCETVQGRWRELGHDPVPLASWAEWQLNGGVLHPFYDGCGRISRSFGALLLIRGGCLLPLYDGMAGYFEHGNRGTAAFCDYVRFSIVECRRWLSAAAA